MRRGSALAAGVLAAVLTSGCAPAMLNPKALEEFAQRQGVGDKRGLLAESLMQAPQVQEALGILRKDVRYLAGALTVLLGFACWYRTKKGKPLVEVLGTFAGGLVFCGYVLASVGKPLGPDQLLLQAGLALSRKLEPSRTEFVRGQTEGFKATVRLVMRLKEIVGRGADREDERDLAAVATAGWYSTPAGSQQLALNGLAAYIMALVMQVVLAWVLAFYWVLAPLFGGVLAILPASRQVCVAYWKTYASVCVWPLMFAITERLMASLPFATSWSVVHGVLQSETKSPAIIAEAISQGVTMMFIGNWILFFSYLTVPVAAYLLVSGASRPFRGVLG